MDPCTALQTRQQSDDLPRVLMHQLLERRQEHRRRECRNSHGDDQAPGEQHPQARGRSQHGAMGPERAMGNQEAVGPPEEAEGAPPSQCIGVGIEVRGKPQTTG